MIIIILLFFKNIIRFLQEDKLVYIKEITPNKKEMKQEENTKCFKGTLTVQDLQYLAKSNSVGKALFVIIILMFNLVFWSLVFVNIEELPDDYQEIITNDKID